MWLLTYSIPHQRRTAPEHQPEPQYLGEWSVRWSCVQRESLSMAACDYQIGGDAEVIQTGGPLSGDELCKDDSPWTVTYMK